MRKMLNGKVSDMTWKGYIGVVAFIYAITFVPIFWSDITDWFKEKFGSIKGRKEN